MRIIKKYLKFYLKNSKNINEVNGVELVGPVGPAYGETGIQNKTLNKGHTSVIFCDIDNKIYTEDDYNYIYNNYLKSGGDPLDGFSLENIEKILTY